MRSILRQFAARAAKTVAVAAVFVSASASAVTLPDLGLSSDQVSSIDRQLYSPGASPAVAFGSPIAFGPGYTEFFAGIGGQTLPDGAPDDYDGAASVGFGIGDPFRWIGLEVSSTIISLQDDFGHDGNFNLKLHHALPWRSAIAIGVENTGRWGDAKATESSNYLALTKAFEVAPPSSGVPLTLSLNAGVGDNRFAKPGDSGIGGFGSVAFTFARRISIVGDYTGRDLNVGASLVPFKRVALVITAGMINLGERYGAETEFAGGIGYTHRF